MTTVDTKPLLPELSELKQGVPLYPHGNRTPSTVSGHATVLLLQDDDRRLAADALQPPFAAVEPQSHVPVLIPMHGIGGPARSEHFRASNTYQNTPPPTSSSDATSSAAACATELRKSNRLPTHMPQPHAGAKQSVPRHIPIFSNGVAGLQLGRSFPQSQLGMSTMMWRLNSLFFNFGDLTPHDNMRHDNPDDNDNDNTHHTSHLRIISFPSIV